MGEKFYDKQFPTGKGAELETQKETLPAVEVKNEVIWVNPHFPNAPFALEKDKPCSLGIFLTPQIDGKKVRLNVEVAAAHLRSGIVGRIIFTDDENNLYRDVDLKGIGFVNVYFLNKNPNYSVGLVLETQSNQTRGINYLSNAIIEAEKGEIFLKMGIKTARTLAIIELSEIIDEKGEKITVDTARQTGKILKNNVPVAILRAWGTRTRIDDILLLSDPRESRVALLLEDVQTLVSQDLKQTHKKFVDAKYFEWLVTVVAENIARMHKHGWVHGNLTPHNITLDGRIVDLDTVQKIEYCSEEKKRS